ncbi:hypothetical protein B9Z65_3070 [Elsinoe australis]|uniref:AB hydrolase-1 domain-containing protein n=1 Tax=Elsinoe australis TaxID=40998 RepID=A0A2P7ZUB8_9PEZI|nr:hypothetical protein B9Z65_3070 [Elsinoe australis]
MIFIQPYLTALSWLLLAPPALCTPLRSPQVKRQLWTELPPTPKLPEPISTTTFQTGDGVHLWYQKYNEQAGGDPVVLIHGGLGYSAYFGDVLKQLSASHYVIAVDRRGHGRSTYNANDTFTFEGFASETAALLASENIYRAAWVGWSDGGATTLAGLLDSKINPTISRAFVFAGFQKPEDTNSTYAETAIAQEFIARCREEYAVLQPRANFTDFGTKVVTLEATLPQWSDVDLAKIEGGKVTIAGAEFDEAVNLNVQPHLNKVISGSKLVILPGVSHFAPVQNPALFTGAVEDFLK